MKSIEQRRAELLLDTIQYYASDPSRRSARHGSLCRYYDENTGNRCALGRFMDLSSYIEEIEELSFKELYLRRLLPNTLYDLGSKFLEDLQKLHDRFINYRAFYYDDEPGLARDGKAMVVEIDNAYCGGLLQKSLSRVGRGAKRQP